jgi:DNA-binding NtrC family response regulator
MMTHRILVVDDEPDMIEYLTDTLTAFGYEVRGASSGEQALIDLRAWPCDLVLSDVVMPGMRGTELLRTILTEHPGQKVILMTAFGSIELAIQSLKAGAADFLVKPFKHKVLIQLLRDLLGDSPRSSVEVQGQCLIAESAAMQQLLEVTRRAAATDAPVLITGEPGVGKGALARLIHELGPRAKANMMHVNCAALTSNAQVELFGAGEEGERAARVGALERAQGGTLFLDEIGELPMSLQPQLLAALEAGKARAQGGTREYAVDARLIAASNRDLEAAVSAGAFRAELYWRLNVMRLHIPPLRERREDLLPLAEQILRQHAPRLGHRALTLTEEARAALLRYSWPGNIRELDNLLYRAAILCKQSTITARDLGLPQDSWTSATPASEASEEDLLGFPSLPELERQHIQRALEIAQGNKSHAARLLGIHRKTLYRKLEEQGMLDDED